MSERDGRPTVLYTDPPWAATAGLDTEGTAFVIERDVYGDTVALRAGPRRAGRYLLDGRELESCCRGADAIVVYRCPISAEMLDAAGAGLKVVGRQGVGIDNLNAPLLAQRGLCSFNVPDYCVDEVATHTLALLLALERQVVPAHLHLSRGTFDVYHGGLPRRLHRRTAGVVGFGRIGRAVAQRLRMFYGRVLAFDPYVSADLMEGYGADAAGFDELLASADCILLHCPLTEETRHMIGARALAQVRPGALLVNCARGGLVESEALHAALTAGRLGGAALDVFTPEDPNLDEWYRRVLRLETVVVTSHRAFLSCESEESQRRRVAEAVLSVIRTGALPANAARVT